MCSGIDSFLLLRAIPFSVSAESRASGPQEEVDDQDTVEFAILLAVLKLHVCSSIDALSEAVEKVMVELLLFFLGRIPAVGISNVDKLLEKLVLELLLFFLGRIAMVGTFSSVDELLVGTLTSTSDELVPAVSGGVDSINSGNWLDIAMNDSLKPSAKTKGRTISQ